MASYLKLVTAPVECWICRNPVTPGRYLSRRYRIDDFSAKFLVCLSCLQFTVEERLVLAENRDFFIDHEFVVREDLLDILPRNPEIEQVVLERAWQLYLDTEIERYRQSRITNAMVERDDGDFDLTT